MMTNVSPNAAMAVVAPVFNMVVMLAGVRKDGEKDWNIPHITANSTKKAAMVNRSLRSF